MSKRFFKNQKEQEIFRNFMNKIQKLLKTFEIKKKLFFKC